MDIPWLTELMFEYQYRDKHTGKLKLNATPDRVDNLKQRFEHEDPAVMLEAVNRYKDVGQYFPRIAQLMPHVEMARENARGASFAENARPALGRDVWDNPIYHTDEEIHAFEEARGWRSELDYMEEENSAEVQESAVDDEELEIAF